MAEVDLQKIQSEYELMQKMFNNWNTDLDNASERFARITAATGEPSLRDYNKQTLHLLAKTLSRMQDMHDRMIEVGTTSIKTNGE